MNTDNSAGHARAHDHDDIGGWSGGRTAAAIRAKEVSPSEAVDAAIARIEATNPALNALVYTAFEEARETARAATERVARGADDLPPLFGVPTAMKDLFDFKPGWPTTFGGIPALADRRIDAHCIWAERMENAGAIILGKTNSPVLGFRGITDNPLFGPTRNPFDTERNPGGSSGGSAAAVAAGMVPFAEGTDAGGSIRIPAAWCNVVGFKQSWGRVPSVSRPNMWGTTNPFIFEGVLARHTEDLPTALAALSGPHPADPFASLGQFTDVAAHTRGVEGLRIAYSRDFGGFPVAPEVVAVVDEAVRAFEEAGATVSEVGTRLPSDQFELGELWGRLIAPMNLGVLLGLRAEGIDLLGELRHQLPEPLLRFVDEASHTTVAEYAVHQLKRTQVYDFVQSFFVEHDLLVTPTLACLPVENAAEPGATMGPSEVNGVPVDPSIGWCLTYPINFTGHPAASVPAGFSGHLPVGMQVIGRLGADVLAAAGAIEQVRPWAQEYERIKV